MGKTSSEVKSRYNQKAYDVVSIRVLKGTRDEWHELAEKSGMSLAGFIKHCVEQSK